MRGKFTSSLLLIVEKNSPLNALASDEESQFKRLSLQTIKCSINTVGLGYFIFIILPQLTLRFYYF